MTEPTKAEARRLGGGGPAVFPLALGAMGMSRMYGEADEGESVATLQEAVDRGVTLIDTGDFYASGANELLVGRALRERRDRVLLSVKFGALRVPGGGWSGADGRPSSVKNFLAYSLTRLGVDHIDIYRPARLDPGVPIEETVGAIADMIKAGYVRYVGLSEVGPETIRRARTVAPIADLQIEYSLISRGPEEKIFPLLDQLDVAVTAYGVLSRGLLTGARPSSPGDFRAHLPRFSGANREQNDRLVATLARLAADRGLSSAQLAIAWALAKNPRVLPLIGARTRQQLTDALGAVNVRLTPEEVRTLEAAVPAEAVAGTRYDPSHMKQLDSER